MAFLGVFTTAFSQDDINEEPKKLDILIKDLHPHTVGPKPQNVMVSVMHGNLPVANTRLHLELVDAPDSAYCTCGQATANSNGAFELKWGSLNAGTITLRITARADGYTETTKEFVLSAIDTNLDSLTTSDVNLWIPPSMLENEHYEGVVIIDNAYAHGSEILLTSSNPSHISVDHETIILPGENHAIFSIYPHTATSETVNIFASIDGPLISAESRIYSQQSIPSKLKVIFPSNKTMTDSVITYVFVVDENEAPTRADSDIEILLETGHALDAPDSVTISKGNFYTSFLTKVFGDDTIWAHTTGLKSGHAKIEKTSHEATLQIGIAPNPVGENGHAKYYAWLQVDGQLYSPPRVQVGHIHSNSTSVAGFQAIGLENSESETLYMKNGIASGTIYTRNAGVVSITASFPDVGTATSSIIVGPELVYNDKSISAATCTNEPKRSLYVINSINAWVYPNITNGPISLTVAPYHEKVANDMCLTELSNIDYPNCDPPQTRNTCGLIRYPMEVDGRLVSLSVSPSGVVYDRTVELTQHKLKSFFTEFELDVRDVGDYVLNATTTNVLPASANFSMNSENSKKYELHVTPLPVATDSTMQDIALISITDSEGAIVDTKDVFGRPTKATIAGPTIEDSTVIVTGDSAKFSAALDSGTTITATAPGLVRGVATISLPGIASSIDLDIPNKVHLHEEFPFAMHTVDSAGTLIGTSQDIELVASGISYDLQSRRMNSSLIGNVTMSILTDYGAHQQSVDVFANELDIDVRASEATARVRTPFRIDVLSSSEFDMNVSTSIPWQAIENSTSINVTSDVPGTFPVTITASKRGYAPESKTIHVTVEDYAKLDVSALGTDGMQLELVDVSLSLNTRNSKETTSNIVLPWTREYENLSSAEIIFPYSYGTDDGYIFSNATVNGHSYNQNTIHFSVSSDTNIHAIYDRSVIVSIDGDHDVTGTGHYEYGDDVKLVANTKGKLAFLVIEVFKHWENLPDDARIEDNVVHFTASKNTHVSAVYSDDYIGTLVVLFAAMSLIIGLKYYKKYPRITLSWTLGNFYGTIRSQLAASTENIMHRKDRNKKDKSNAT